MTPEKLQQLAQFYRDNREFITNEEASKMALVVPFIRLLGFDPGAPREVRLEYSADFTQGDGKRMPDRMDFAIFDPTGTKPLMVIEAKPLGTDLRAKAQQLARYIGQMPGLHFGIICDGNRYLFYGDLDQPNVMDAQPFFQFALDDPKADWTRITAFLAKFSRESFNPETLIIDAENNRFRSAMMERLAKSLQHPDHDEAFVRWLTEGIYTGKRTTNVMQRLNALAREIVEPAMMQALSEDFVASLRHRLNVAAPVEAAPAAAPAPAPVANQGKPVLDRTRRSRSRELQTVQALTSPTATVVDEIPPSTADVAFLLWTRQLLSRRGVSDSEIQTRNYSRYFSVSVGPDERWFVRFFPGVRKKLLYTHLTVDEVRQYVPDAIVVPSQSPHGLSRAQLDRMEDLPKFAEVVLRSLELRRTGSP